MELLVNFGRSSYEKFLKKNYFNAFEVILQLPVTQLYYCTIFQLYRTTRRPRYVGLVQLSYHFYNSVLKESSIEWWWATTKVGRVFDFYSNRSENLQEAPATSITGASRRWLSRVNTNGNCEEAHTMAKCQKIFGYISSVTLIC